MNLQHLIDCTNELKKEKELSIQIANKVIENAQDNYIKYPTFINQNKLFRALNDKIKILNYYENILI